MNYIININGTKYLKIEEYPSFEDFDKDITDKPIDEQFYRNWCKDNPPENFIDWDYIYELFTENITYDWDEYNKDI